VAPGQVKRIATAGVAAIAASAPSAEGDQVHIITTNLLLCVPAHLTPTTVQRLRVDAVVVPTRTEKTKRIVVMLLGHAASVAWWFYDWIATFGSAAFVCFPVLKYRVVQGLRIIFVLIVPSVTLYLLAMRDPSWTPVLYKSLVRSLQWCGPSFIKLGQWGGTRSDILPPELCKELSTLHESVAPHSLAYTRQIIEQDFRKPVEAIFSAFHPGPIGSGCIAQVYKAVLIGPNGENIPVAVKVRHPYVDTIIR